MEPQILGGIVLERVSLVDDNSRIDWQKRFNVLLVLLDLEIGKEQGVVCYKNIGLVPLFSCLPLKTFAELPAFGSGAVATLAADAAPCLLAYSEVNVRHAAVGGTVRPL